MTARPRTATRASAALAVAVTASALAACSAAGGGSRTTPSAAPATGTSPGPALTLPSPVAPLSPVPTHCPARGTAVIPDGIWDGPLTLRVRAVAGVPATRSTGSGRLQLLVQRGQVVQGVWTLSGQAGGRGTADNGDATARLVAQVAGTARGPATRPVLHGAWTVSGTVRVTSPVSATVPVASSGEGDAALQVQALGCDAVVATFAPPSNRRNPRARLAATARWTGHRRG